VIPESTLKELRISPLRSERVSLADDRLVERDVGEVGIEAEGYMASATPAVFGEGTVCPLGAVTMEQLGLPPDPVTKRLRPVEALLM